MANSNSLAYPTVVSARSNVEPIDPSEVPLWVKEIFVAQCFLVSILTVLIFDTRTNFINQMLINADILSSHYI